MVCSLWSVPNSWQYFSYPQGAQGYPSDPLKQPGLAAPNLPQRGKSYLVLWLAIRYGARGGR